MGNNYAELPRNTAVARQNSINISDKTLPDGGVTDLLACRDGGVVVGDYCGEERK